MGTDDRREITADLSATLAARRDLSADYEPALVDAFAERLDKQIQKRIKAEVTAAKRRDDDDGGQGFVLVLVSLGCGIPITAIAESTGLAGIAASWAGIVGVNAVHAWSRRRRSR